MSKGGVENVSALLAKQVKQSEKCSDQSCLADLFVFTSPVGARVFIDGQAVKGVSTITNNANIGRFLIFVRDKILEGSVCASLQPSM